jgi:hypothetical protein
VPRARAVSEIPASLLLLHWQGMHAQVREITSLEIPLDEFQLASWEEVDPVEFDPSRIVGLQFSVDASSDFDFCIRALKFLDADGVEVTP